MPNSPATSDLMPHQRPWHRCLAAYRQLTPAGRLVFFPLAPLLASMVLGWNRMSFGPEMGRGLSTLYWAGLVGAIWVAASTGTLLVAALGHRRRWPTWLVALSGALLGVVLFYWPIASYRRLGWSMLPGDAGFGGPPLPLPTLDYLPQLLGNTLPGILYWTLTVWLVSRMRVPVPATQSPAVASPRNPAPEAPALRARLPAHLDGEILALKAEDHYVRVYTTRGDTLVHHRFRDAMAELEGIDGLQVHRSFWVRRSAISRRYSEGHGQFLQLKNDLRVPVSRSYHHVLRGVGAKAPPASLRELGLE